MAVSALILPDTDAEPGKLTTASGQFEDLGGRITGTGGSLHAEIRKGATTFSDLIADPIRDLAEKNKSSWQKAVQGSTWGAAVTAAWSENVTEFRTRRQEILDRWTAAAAADFGVTMDVTQPGMAEAKAAERFNAEVDEKGAAVKGELMREFQRVWNKLEEDAGERTTELKAGPTKATLATLVDTGALGWAGFNLWGAKSPTPLDGAAGKALADKINAALKRGEAPSAADMANFNALLAHAAYLQKNGGTLSAGERAFLSSLFSGLDRKDMNKNFSNLITPGWLDAIKDKAAADGLRAALGNGLLALSDERLGGGYDQLPEGVREILDAEQREGMNKGDWGLGLSGLAGLLAATGGKYAAVKLQGGAEFSALTTIRITQNLTDINIARDEKLALGALEAAFRNPRGAGDILTGKYDDITGYGKDTNEWMMRELWGRKWPDDGKTVAGLIDWIPGALDSKDPGLSELAAKSAFEVYTTTTNVEKTRWDESAFQWMTDGFGRVGSDPAAPLASRNPFVTGAIGDLIGHDLDDVFGDAKDGVETRLDGGKISLDWETRERLFEIAMADKGTADRLGKAIYADIIKEAGGIENWSPGEGQGFGSKNGTLANLLDAGLARLQADTGDGLNDATDAAKAAKDEQRVVRWANMGAAVLKEAVLAIPGVDKAGDMTKLGTKVFFELAKTAPGSAHTEGWWNLRETGTGISGEKAVPGFASLNGQVYRSVLEGSGAGYGDIEKHFNALDERLRGDLRMDDLIQRDGTLREWSEIDPERRRAASAIYYDTMTDRERAVVDQYLETFRGERDEGNK
ncbi:TPR repeat region-containing protein [Phytomonospora endophytica]|uniref:TPR repeat domain-containing protein n=1 Tax=Phytomonospora endophytica TaxID=714109 RepID=A0A841FL46_9ACTN|nr:hypothetical protein [Phytomonospora endophytica]MBB6036584.1 hypothetical protein [Phytomonospora endophytica]GIG65905.1 hypothetical protein Pen01_22000 [Phytomonospora endophytica]